MLFTLVSGDLKLFLLNQFVSAQLVSSKNCRLCFRFVSFVPLLVKYSNVLLSMFVSDEVLSRHAKILVDLVSFNLFLF